MVFSTLRSHVRAAVTGLAAINDPALARWIGETVAFPNGMVDRITPATGPREREMAASFGLGDDPVPVTCEPFRQWVLEDNFPQGRPAFEKVGVTLTPHVHNFEMMKIRILNGGHATIAYPGGLMDIEYVHEAMANPLIRGMRPSTPSYSASSAARIGFGDKRAPGSWPAPGAAALCGHSATAPVQQAS